MLNLTVGVVGSGATGGYLVGRLAHAGVRVILVACGRTLDAVRTSGVTITDTDGSRRTSRPARVVAADEIDEPVDLVLLCVKTYDTEAALPIVSRLLKSDGHVLCLQNGVRGEYALAHALGEARVLAGVLYIGAHRTAPNTIECTASPRLHIGSFGPSESPATKHVAEMFRAANVPSTVSPRIRETKWAKFLFNCGLNPLTAITGQSLRQLLDVPNAATVFRDLVAEAAAVALADGAPLAENSIEATMATAAQLDISSSMAEDLSQGRPLEVDAFSSFVLSLGAKYGVPTPATQTVHGILAALQSARRNATD